MRMFVPFTEQNEWEGETWTFWLLLTGNESELKRLFILLAEERFEYEPEFSLDLNDVVSEEQVDRICARAGTGYFMSDNKISGKFICPDIEASNEDLSRLFYKGRIRDHFVE